MSFNNYLNRWLKKGSRALEEIARAGAIRLILKENSLSYQWDTSNLSEPSSALVSLARNQVSNMLEMYLLGKIVTEGPKVFEVDQVAMEMLIETDVNVEMRDYAQPFDTVIVQLPEKFSKGKVIKLLQAGEVLGGERLPDTTKPSFCIIHHEREIGTIVFALFFDTGISIKTGFTVRPETTIEDVLGQPYGRPFKDSMETSKEETKLLEDMTRACLNYCLLVDEVGARRLGYDNESHANRLRERARRGVRKEENERELRQLPVRYELDQRVELYRTVGDVSQLPQSTGRRNCPHHRRGHYRMVPCGVGRTERRRRRIPPVFVNADLFLGNVKNTKVTYHGSSS
jgi:hypothetical protein